MKPWNDANMAPEIPPNVAPMAMPDPKEWVPLAVVAHLIQGERFNQAFLTSLIDGYEITADGFGSIVDAQVAATAVSYTHLPLPTSKIV